MKKICFVLGFLAIVLSLVSCGKVDETNARKVVDEFFGYIEQGEYDAASEIFSAKYDYDKNFSQYMDEVERSIGIDFQSGIEILECTVNTNGPNSYYGLNCIDFDIQAVIGDRDVLLSIDILDNEGSLQICSFVVYEDALYNSNYYQFSPFK